MCYNLWTYPHQAEVADQVINRCDDAEVEPVMKHKRAKFERAHKPGTGA